MPRDQKYAYSYNERSKYCSKYTVQSYFFCSDNPDSSPAPVARVTLIKDEKSGDEERLLNSSTSGGGERQNSNPSVLNKLRDSLRRRGEKADNYNAVAGRVAV